MSKFLTVDIIKCLLLISVFSVRAIAQPQALEVNTAAPVCGAALSTLSPSFETLLDDYADLIISAEDTAADSAESVFLKTALEAKNQQLLSIVHESEVDNVKARLNAKLEALRKNRAVDVATQSHDEALARDAEAMLFTVNFDQGATTFSNQPYSRGELSPHGKVFAAYHEEPGKKTRITFISTETGRVLFVGETPNTDVRVKFLNEDNHVIITDDDRTKNKQKVNHSAFDLNTGKLIFRASRPYKGPTEVITLDISRDGKRALVAKDGKVTLTDLDTKKELTTKVKTTGFIRAHFDSRGENIFIENFDVKAKKNKNVVIYYDMVKEEIIWKKAFHEAWGVENKKYYLVLEDKNDDPIVLIDAMTGQKIRRLAVRTRSDVSDWARSIMSEDGAMLYVSRHGHYTIYHTHGKDAEGVMLQGTNPGLIIQNPKFIDNNSKFIATSNGKVLVWDAGTGAKLIPHLTPDPRWYHGLDDQDNLVGTERLSAASPMGDWNLNLQRWTRKVGGSDTPK